MSQEGECLEQIRLLNYKDEIKEKKKLLNKIKEKKDAFYFL